MIIKEHTRNQKRMYRIHKQEEKIHNLELMLGSKNQEIKRLKEEYIILQNASDEVEEELQQRINKAINYINEKTHDEDTGEYLGYPDFIDDEYLISILKGVDKE